MSNNEKKTKIIELSYKQLIGGAAILISILGIGLFALVSTNNDLADAENDTKVAATTESTNENPSVQSEIDELITESEAPEEEATSTIESEIDELVVAPEEYVHEDEELQAIKETYPDLYETMESLTEKNLQGVGLLFYNVMENVAHANFTQVVQTPEGTYDDDYSFYYDRDALTIRDFVSLNYGLYMPEDYEASEYRLNEVVSVAISYYDEELDQDIEQSLYHFPETSYNGTFTRLNDLNDDSADIYTD